MDAQSILLISICLEGEENQWFKHLVKKLNIMYFFCWCIHSNLVAKVCNVNCTVEEGLHICPPLSAVCLMWIAYMVCHVWLVRHDWTGIFIVIQTYKEHLVMGCQQKPLKLHSINSLFHLMKSYKTAGNSHLLNMGITFREGRFL